MDRQFVKVQRIVQAICVHISRCAHMLFACDILSEVLSSNYDAAEQKPFEFSVDVACLWTWQEGVDHFKKHLIQRAGGSGQTEAATKGGYYLPWVYCWI